MIRALPADSDKTMSEVVRIGLVIYNIALDQKKMGRRIAVVKDGNVIKILILS